MTLTEDQMKVSLQKAEKVAARCGRTCRLGYRVKDGIPGVYHNGIGDSDSSTQHLYSPKLLALNAPELTTRLAGWITDLHDHKPTDLNKET